MLKEEVKADDAAAVDWLDVPQPPPREELPTEDGIPLESPWHRSEINLLLESLDYHWRDRSDYYAGGNMYIYFSVEQVRNQDYRGPDFYVVTDVDGAQDREAWVVWEEGGRYPDLIIELLSRTTAEIDKTIKKELYERVFRTPEYYCYDPATQTLLGWRLRDNRYQEIQPDDNGRMWSEVLQLWLGAWEGKFIGQSAIWLRFFDEENNLVPILAEAQAARAEQEATRAEQEAARAEQEATRAEQEAARAEQEAAARRAAEDEVARLRQELSRLRGDKT